MPVRRVSGLSLAFVALLGIASCSPGSDGYKPPTGPPPPGGGTLELNSGTIANGGTYQHRFMAAGTYPYHCEFHAPMVGSVVVNASAPDTLDTVVVPGSMTPYPSALVKPGGRVVWTNNSGVAHTVTSD